jgi:hypothetical protein
MKHITAFDTDRHYNAQLMEDCAKLGYLVGPILDLTYGKGNFWTLLPDAKIYSNDLDENLETDYAEDFTSTPWAGNSWGTVVFDPPYRLGGTPTTPEFDLAYGINEYRTKADVKALIEQGTREACRIAGKYALVKVQDHVSSGVLQPQTTWVINAAPPDAVLVDSLHVIGGRPQPEGRSQKRARHGYSTLLVFTKKRPRRKS